MIPDDPELRRALEARSGLPPTDFGASLRQRLAAGRPATSWTPAVAILAVLALSVSSVGVLLASRSLGNHGPGAASGVRTPLPTPPTPSPDDSPIPMPTIAQISAPSADVMWVLVGGEKLFFSADQGTHFRRASLPGYMPIESFSFADDRTGWFLTGSSPATQCESQSITLWRTLDGGATWRQLDVRGIADQQCKHSVTFVDRTHGYIAAWDDNHSPTVYATADGGTTWRGATIPDGPLFVTSGGGFTLRVDWVKSFGSTLYLQASGRQEDASWPLRSFIYTSDDQGATWVWKQKLLPSAMTVMVTELRWLQYEPDIMETVNGGQQFHPYTTDLAPLSPAEGGTVVVFAGASVGYASGRGQIERSFDGGSHWTMIKTPGT